MAAATELRAWEFHETLRDGTLLLVRPLKPQDAALYPDFLADVTHDDLRLRFFASLRELSPRMIAKLTHVDYARDMALIAIEEATGRMLGVVRLHRDKSGDGGEYAVLVRSSLKGHGLGWLLMERIIAYGRAAGFGVIHGQVLGENHTMLQMCEQLGFDVADDPTERGIKVVTLPLAPPGTSALPHSTEPPTRQ